jgi:predicted component of type VI protein secretion system
VDTGAKKPRTKTREMLLKELEQIEVVQVTAFCNGRPVGSWDFHGEAISIGRSRSADLRLATDTISRVHAILERTPDGGLRVRDAGSRNGIYLNDDRVDVAVLAATDVIRIGKYTLRCVVRNQGDISSLRVRRAGNDRVPRDPSAPGSSSFRRRP